MPLLILENPTGPFLFSMMKLFCFVPGKLLNCLFLVTLRIGSLFLWSLPAILIMLFHATCVPPNVLLFGMRMQLLLFLSHSVASGFAVKLFIHLLPQVSCLTHISSSLWTYYWVSFSTYHINTANFPWPIVACFTSLPMGSFASFT